MAARRTRSGTKRPAEFDVSPRPLKRRRQVATRINIKFCRPFRPDKVLLAAIDASRDEEKHQLLAAIRGVTTSFHEHEHHLNPPKHPAAATTWRRERLSSLRRERSAGVREANADASPDSAALKCSFSDGRLSSSLEVSTSIAAIISGREGKGKQAASSCAPAPSSEKDDDLGLRGFFAVSGSLWPIKLTIRSESVFAILGFRVCLDRAIAPSPRRRRPCYRRRAVLASSHSHFR
nr:unnamed protein product [Digitaria exilis]